MADMPEQSTQDSPVVQLVERVVRQAIVQGSSDIHLEPHDAGLRVRYRIDGVLHERSTIEKKLITQIVSRIKVLAHLDTTEKRIPQDGKWTIHGFTHPIDIRVATFPTMYGEKVVLRILDRTKTMVDLTMLGLNDSLLAAYRRLLERPNGFFLVSGPTGSGKTTTLYATLAALNSPQKNIITLEDPVEYSLSGITQGQINPDVGFTFEKGMRALLRQDPNVIMVGEIRDRQTAQIAIEAALTGHVVLSTVHTHDAPSVIMRLMDMGIEPFLINAAVSGVLAQRLARKICGNCRFSAEPTDQEQELLKRYGVDLPALYQGRGCDACFKLGYKGRVGIFELLIMSPQLRIQIGTQPSVDAITAQACKDGMQQLREDGLEKVRGGIITLQEFVRVVS